MSTLQTSYVPLSAGLFSPGGGPVSSKLRRLTLEAFASIGRQSHTLAAVHDLYSLQAESQAGEHDAVLDEDTLAIGRRFLFALPKTLPTPQIGLDNDGEISFDWFAPHKRVFSISIRVDGRVSYAGRLGARRTIHGTEAFDDAIPEQVGDLLRDFCS